MAQAQGMKVTNQTSQTFRFQITDNDGKSYVGVVRADDSWTVPASFPCDQWIVVEITNPEGPPHFHMVFQALNAKEVLFVVEGGAYALNCLPGVCGGGCDTRVYTRHGRKSAQAASNG